VFFQQHPYAIYLLGLIALIIAISWLRKSKTMQQKIPKATGSRDITVHHVHHYPEENKEYDNKQDIQENNNDTVYPWEQTIF